MLTGGQVHDVTVAGELSEDIVGCAVIAGRGYDSNEYRRALEGNNNEVVIPGRRNRKAVSFVKISMRPQRIILKVVIHKV
jgi:hypothetical protein